jgi:hypothetical protein
MTMVFDSFAKFAMHLGRLVAVEIAAEQAALHKVGALVEAAAKKKIGNYQPGWAKLAATTLEGWGPFPGKIDLGYAPPDNPLLRTGGLKGSYEHSVGVNEVAIGSNDDKAVWHELGTSKMPARPVLFPAAHEKIPEILAIVGTDVCIALSGGGVPTGHSAETHHFD